MSDDIGHMRDAIVRRAMEIAGRGGDYNEAGSFLGGHSPYYQSFAGAVDQLIDARLVEFERKMTERYG